MTSKNALLLENIHVDAKVMLERAGFNVKSFKKALNEDELIAELKDVQILGIRSKTMITEKVINNAPSLQTVGAFCIGTNQIDIKAANQKGICIFNAPYSNTRSVVELAIAEIIILLRRITDFSQQLHQGVWNKSSINCREVRGKKLGIVGYGNIGMQLSIIAESLGIDVLYYDIAEKLTIGNATRCYTLEELLPKVDILTIHVDGNKKNLNMISSKEIALMKDGAILLNLSRGHVVDIEALATALKSGKLSGAAIDVYPEEPAGNENNFKCALTGLPNVIITPHIAGSTEEAQENIAHFVPEKLTQYMESGNTSLSVNFPRLKLPKPADAHRIVHIHRNSPGIMAQINKVIADMGVNVAGQYLKTNDEIGYVITDVETTDPSILIEGLSAINRTIKVRII